MLPIRQGRKTDRRKAAGFSPSPLYSALAGAAVNSGEPKNGLASWNGDSLVFHRKESDFLIFWAQVEVSLIQSSPLNLLGDSKSENLCLLRLQI